MASNDAQQAFLRRCRSEAVAQFRASRLMFWTKKGIRDRQIMPDDLRDPMVLRWRRDGHDNPVALTDDNITVVPLYVADDAFIPQDGKQIVCFVFFPGGRDVARLNRAYAVPMDGWTAAKKGLCTWNRPRLYVQEERDECGRLKNRDSEIKVRDSRNIIELSFTKFQPKGTTDDGKKRPAIYQTYIYGKRAIWMDNNPPKAGRVYTVQFNEFYNCIECNRVSDVAKTADEVADTLPAQMIQLTTDGTRLDAYVAVGLTTTDDLTQVDGRISYLLDMEAREVRSLVSRGKCPLVNALKEAGSELKVRTREGLDARAQAIRDAALVIRPNAPKYGHIWFKDVDGERVVQVSVFALLNIGDDVEADKIEAKATALHKKRPGPASGSKDPVVKAVADALEAAGQDGIDFDDATWIDCRKTLILEALPVAVRLAQDAERNRTAAELKGKKGRPGRPAVKPTNGGGMPMIEAQEPAPEPSDTDQSKEDAG
ncbi:MAG: hypothetical protein ABIH67_00590 [Candidatus Uhrbacteria bacterium]